MSDQQLQVEIAKGPTSMMPALLPYMIAELKMRELHAQEIQLKLDERRLSNEFERLDDLVRRIQQATAISLLALIVAFMALVTSIDELHLLAWAQFQAYIQDTASRMYQYLFQ